MRLSARDQRMHEAGWRKGMVDAAAAATRLANALKDGDLEQPDPARAVMVAALTIQRLGQAK